MLAAGVRCCAFVIRVIGKAYFDVGHALKGSPGCQKGEPPGVFARSVAAKFRRVSADRKFVE